MPVVEDNLMAYYGDFTPHRSEAGLDLLRSFQHLARFGGTALSIATVLVLLGLIVGDRRSRLGVAMFGIGGLGADRRARLDGRLHRPLHGADGGTDDGRRRSRAGRAVAPVGSSISRAGAESRKWSSKPGRGPSGSSEGERLDMRELAAGLVLGRKAWKFNAASCAPGENPR